MAWHPMSAVAPEAVGMTCDDKHWASRIQKANKRSRSQGNAAQLLLRSHRTDRCYAQQIQSLDFRCGLWECETSCAADVLGEATQGVSTAAKMLVRSNRSDSSSKRRLENLDRRSGLLRGCQKALIGALQGLTSAPRAQVVPFTGAEVVEVKTPATPERDFQVNRNAAHLTSESIKSVPGYLSSVSPCELDRRECSNPMRISPNASTLCPASPDMLHSLTPNNWTGTGSPLSVCESSLRSAKPEDAEHSAAVPSGRAQEKPDSTLKPAEIKGGVAAAGDTVAESASSPSRPRFARTTREQRVKQLQKVVDEFCSLDFETVAAEAQGGLVLRMLTILKSFSSQDIYWTDSGEKCKEARYALLGMQEQDVEATSKFVHRADELSENRQYRQAHEVLCQARAWLRASAADLQVLRAEWQATKMAEEQELQNKGRHSEQGELEAMAESDSYRFLPRRIPASSAEFSVVSMNILSGELGRPKTHGFCTPECLDWENRRAKLIDGVCRCMPDVLLLQEVQGTTQRNKHDHFTDLKDTLAGVGYELGAYGRLAAANGSELGTEPQSKSKKKPHIGNAIFFKGEVWQRLADGRISFAQVLAARCADDAAQSEHYASGNQVAVWTRLQHMQTQRVVVVVSVHVRANWRNPDTQVSQIDAMLNELTQVVHDGDSLLIGGDFNSMPTSGVYTLLDTGQLAADHPDANPKNPKVSRLCGEDGFRSCFKLSSAYAVLCDREPEFTTMTGVSPGSDEQPFSGTLDYIWFSPQTLRPVPGTAIDLPSAADAAKENGGLPNSQIPSDHVPLGCAIAFSLSE